MDGLFPILISPAAMGLLPAVVLHTVIFAYLVQRKNKSRTTWFLTGWMTCLLLLTLSQFTPRVIYSPVGGYIDWMGSILFAWMALFFALGFAYHFPRPAFGREAIVALTVIVLTGVALCGLMILEATLTTKPPVYNFEDFWFGLAVEGKQLLPLASFNLFDILHPLGQVWLLGVLVRKTIHLSRLEAHPVAHSFGWRQAIDALWHPQGKDAQTSRALAVVLALVPLAALSATLEQIAFLPAGSFSALYLIAVFAFIVTYLNYSPESSTLMVKLVGITLLTLLAMMSLVNSFVLDDTRADETRTWQVERPVIQAAVETSNLSLVPNQVQYIAARPASGGLFSATYRMLVSRVDVDTEHPNVNAQTLAAEDARLKQRMEQGQFEVLLETPWIGPLTPEQGQRVAAEWSQLTPTEGVRSYRGVYATSTQHYIRYTFTSRDGTTLYEVGYSYPDYRQTLHDRAVPLVGLTLGMTLLILLVFPLFFRVSLVRPLDDLLRGMRQVNDGMLDVAVPIRVEDEIGFLTRSFNRMVHSLETSNHSLRREVAERRKAETEARASETRFRTLFEHAPLCMFRVDLSQAAPTILQANRQAERVYGWSSAELAGACLDRILPPPIAAEISRAAVAGDQRVITLEAVGQRRDHSTFPIRVSAALESGMTLNSFVVVEDRTAEESRRSEEQAIAAERQRMAREIHDGLAQNLAALLVRVGLWQDLVDQDPAQMHRELDALGDLLRANIREVRRSIFALRPVALEDLGFAPALRALVADLSEQNQWHVALQVPEAERLPAPLEPVLFRILQEALHNIAKHARAGLVSIELVRIPGERLALSIRDDGGGFDPAALDGAVRAGHVGLAQMRERVIDLHGTFELFSQIGRGTEIRVTLPISKT